MHPVTLFCCAAKKTLSRIATALARDNERPLREILPAIELDAMYAQACAALDREQACLLSGNFRLWSSYLTHSFIEISRNICSAVKSSNMPCICLSTTNSRYINCWRKACSQQGIGLRIVYLRDFTVFSDGGTAALQEFQCAVHVALQAVPGLYDIAVFDLADLDENGVDIRSLLLGQVVDFTPDMVRNAPVNDKLPEGLPLELRLVHAMFKNLRMGNIFVADASPGRSRELNFLELACHPSAALARMDIAPVNMPGLDSQWRYAKHFAIVCDRLALAQQSAKQMKTLRECLKESKPHNMRAADVLKYMEGKADTIPSIPMNRPHEDKAPASKIIKPCRKVSNA